MKRLALVMAITLLSFGAVIAQQTFQHTTDKGNIRDNSSFLTFKGLDGNPNAIIIVEYDAFTSKANPHAVGVWYNGSQWAVFNQDRAAMPAGLTFSISWRDPDTNAFWQKTTTKNLSNGRMMIDSPLLDNNPSAAFYVSQIWNPEGSGGVYNDADITVEYDKAIGKWMVKNINGAPLADGAAFNISIVGKSSVIGSLIKPVEIINPLAIDPTDKQPKFTDKDPEITDKDPKFTDKDPKVTDPVLTINLGAVLSAPTLMNRSFEFGLSEWTATGNAFVNQPVEGNTVSSERVLLGMQYDRGGVGGDYWKGIAYPIGIKGDNWIGTYEKGNGDGPTGTILSSQMRITDRYLHFLLGGGKDINRLYVELQIRKQDYENAWGAGKRGFYGETDDGYYRVNRITPLINSEELYRYYFDMDGELNHQFLNKTVRIQIVDDSSRGWGHINVDDFQQSPSISEFIQISRGGFGLSADRDKPVWGFADTHAHWMNHIGLNGLMHGSPGGNWRTSNVRRDIPPCDGFNHGLPTITPGLLIAQTEKAAFRRFGERIADPGNLLCATFAAPSALVALPISGPGALVGAVDVAQSGAMDVALGNVLFTAMFNPLFQACGYQFTRDVFAKHYNNNIPNAQIGNYVDYPRWNTFFHQTMHISWVRRSYDGGQRLMVVHVGTAKSWEFNSSADGRMGAAKTHIENAVRALKTLVDLNSDWLEVAYTPQKAREIILNNKMAIVIGVEQAEIGNYFNSVADEVNWLDQLGVRHVFPIHNINNKLGGAAIFNSALNSYNDLVNRDSQDSTIKAFRIRAGSTNESLADRSFTQVNLKGSFMRQGMRLIPIAGFGTIPFFYINSVPAEYGYNGIRTGQKNAEGLTDKGRGYITALMRKGMLIDVDHMSDLSQDEAMRLLGRHNYPMISSHSNFRELRATVNHPTEDEAKMRTEFTIHDRRVSEVNNAGGMFGIMTQQNDIESVQGNPVRNNAAGGTPSFAQAYWYVLQKTGGVKGIAFGSDFNGFAPQIAPRFGTDVAVVLEGDGFRNEAPLGQRAENNDRRVQAFQQTNGVKYDTPINTYHYHRFAKPSFLTMEERDIWEAIAIAKSGTPPSAAWQPGGGLINVERTGLQQDKIRNLAKGFAATPVGDYLSFLDCPEYILKGDCPAERKAAFMAVHGFDRIPQNLREGRTAELFVIINPIYNLWRQFENGPNEPLRRSFAYQGGRDFDYNLDGLAHYGMYPDLIQDMKNLGLSPQQLRPLFIGAEQYIEMWERADAAKSSVGN